MSPRAGLVLLLALLASCTQRSVYVDPASSTDRMLYFFEVDRNGVKHPISSKELDLENKETKRVPNPALVDIDSLLEIKVRKPPSDPAAELVGGNAQDLLDEKDQILALMELLDELTAARAKTLDAHRTGVPVAELDALIENLADLKIKFVDAFKELHPKGSDAHKAANKLVGSGGGLGALKPFLQEEIDAIQARDQAIKDEVKTRSTTLRLEAFLDSPGEELVALHVDKYDSLDEQRLAVRDRAGLNLSETERAELTKQMEKTEAIAQTLNAVKAKEISIKEALPQTLGIVSPKLAALVERAQILAEKLTDPERLAKVKEDFEKAAQAAKTAAEDTAQGLSADFRAKAEALPDELVGQLTTDADAAKLALQALVKAQALVDSWKSLKEDPDPTTMLNIATQSKEVYNDLRGSEAILDLPGWIADAFEKTTTLIKLEAKAGADETTKRVVAEFETWLNGPEVAAAYEHLRGYYADVQEASEIIQEVQLIVGLGDTKVDRVAPEVPEAFDVDIEQLQDTSLDLKRVASKDGDTILVRGTLKAPGRDPVESTANFKITHYGWYAKLVASVVLVRPDEVASGDNDYRFAPALGWMHHYRPRPEDDGATAGFFRPLRPAAGIHAIFLNFDNEDGFGLGGTVSFWEDRLQVGSGYNFSADNSDEGRIYYFVGSDLFGMLQAVGIGDQ